MRLNERDKEKEMGQERLKTRKSKRESESRRKRPISRTEVKKDRGGYKALLLCNFHLSLLQAYSSANQAAPTSK